MTNTELADRLDAMAAVQYRMITCTACGSMNKVGPWPEPCRKELREAAKALRRHD